MPHPTSRTLTAALLCMLLIALPAMAQTFQVLHSFTGAEGMQPTAGLTPGGPGVFYGTASTGGEYDHGTVFKMTRHGSSWTLLPIYAFKSLYDGANPLSGVIIGRDGALYGTTIGFNDGQGTLFKLQPQATPPGSPLVPWQLTLLHTFTGANGDGDQPVYGPLITDQAGNIYGTTQFGGANTFFGTLWEASPGSGGWSETVLASFDLPTNGPLSGAVMDSAGNFYGTTADGEAVFEVSPNGSGWTTTILHSFDPQSTRAYGTLIRDQLGNLFGASASGGTDGCGIVYELSPSGGGWTYQVIHTFACPGEGVYGELTLDAAGNLYGVRSSGGAHDDGQIFKMTPSNGSWTFTDLYDFNRGEGLFAYGAIVFDAQGNMYGTTESGGQYGHGIVWELTP